MSHNGNFLEQGQAMDGGVYQGAMNSREAEDLAKALSAGYPLGGQASGLVGGGVLQVESLEATLRSVTFEQKNLVFWPACPTDKAFSTVEQYNRLVGYGSNGKPYFAEGGQPGEEDSTYVRDTQRIVYFGTKRKVTHPMMLVRTSNGDVVAQQTKEGTMWLLKTIEREMYWGNAYYTNSGEHDGHLAALPQTSIEMNGLLQQLLRGGVDSQQQSGDFQGYGADKGNLKDVRGATLVQDDLEDAALAVFENFGMANEMHSEPAVISALSKLFYPKERITQMGVPDGRAGYVLREFVSSAGTFSLKPNVFLRPRQGVEAGQPHPQAPATPGAVTITSAAVPAGSSASDFIGSEVYQYVIRAENDRGEGLGTASTAGTVTTSGHQLQLAIPATAGAKAYAVYRSAAGGAAGTEQFVGKVAPVSVGGAATFIDRNRKLPGLGEAYLLTMSPERIVFKQLTPLSKINLAITSASLEWFMILYGALIVFMPRQHFVLRNAGR